MPHAFAQFIQERMDERGLRQKDLVERSGMSRALVSKWVTDDREKLTRLPEKETVDRLAKALSVSPEFMLGKAVESLGLGYTSGDFINSVATASDDELLREIGQRLTERGEERADRSAPNKPDDPEAGGGQVVDIEKPPSAKAGRTHVKAARKVGRQGGATDDSR